MSETGNMTVGLRGVSVTDNILKLQTGFLMPGYTDDLSLELYLDGESLDAQVLDCTTLKGANESISYAVVVDVSGSVKADHLTEIKDTVKTLVENMREIDRMSIILMGNDVSVSEFTGDKESLLAMVDALETSHEDTNLYYAVDRALSVLEADVSEEHFGKCIVILSDGADEQVDGITLNEAERHIESARIPVYTVAVSFDEKDAAKVEDAKVLGSFARLSPAGIHQVIGKDGLTAGDAAATIAEHMQNSMLLKVDVKDLSLQKAEVYLELVARSDVYGTSKDGYTIPASVITKGQVEEVTATSPEEIIETTVSDSDITTAAPAFSYGWIAMGIGVIFLLVIIGILIKGRADRKKKSAESDAMSGPSGQAEAENGGQSRSRTDGQPEMYADLDGAGAANAGSAKTTASSGAKKSTREIVLTKIGPKGHEEKHIVLTEDIPYLWGRAAGDAPKSIQSDAQVSGRHAQFLFRAGEIFIEDLNSTNGTFVNGIPVKETHKLADNDKISFGDNEWRINFR